MSINPAPPALSEVEELPSKFKHFVSLDLHRVQDLNLIARSVGSVIKSYKARGVIAIAHQRIN